jgi:hypothetical protein
MITNTMVMIDRLRAKTSSLIATSAALLLAALATGCLNGTSSLGADAAVEIKPYQFRSDGSAGIEYARTFFFKDVGADADSMLEVKFNGELTRAWDLVSVDGFVGGLRSHDKMDPQPIPLRTGQGPADSRKIWIMNAKDGVPYTFVLKLKPKDRRANRDTALRFIQSDDTAIQIRQLPRQ